ncbi:MAG: long-chain fatty acid--CoA ligase [Candidatus Eremiobacteraeota bacterium]|nr:long-chain fatty acid--CoA ligase [Candidatus Eremiobacteraeota bacterium]
MNKHAPQGTRIADQTAADLDGRIAAFINQVNPNDAEFRSLALELFAYQYDNNAPYQALCDQRGRSPKNVDRWQEVPAVTAASFGDARLACFPADRTAFSFVSSGTSRGGLKPSVHELENATLYDASLLTHFRRWVLPDCRKIRMLLLSPAFEEAPRSSLAYMLSRLYTTYGSGGGFFIRNGALDAQAMTAALRESREPVLVFGTAFAFVHFLDHCRRKELRFSLATGSRILETGGFKGKSRSVRRDELYDGLSYTFGVPLEFCISEYGMCELGSQWYDATLGDVVAGRPSRPELKMGPHWARTLVVDPVTAQELPAGATGLLQCFDLTNRGSVAAVLTADLAVGWENGFHYVGRFDAAAPKGCSITVDTMLRSHA